jgi:hypothetical protein
MSPFKEGVMEFLLAYVVAYAIVAWLVFKLTKGD